MIGLYVAAAILLALSLMIVVEIVRLRAAKHAPATSGSGMRHPRRHLLLEDRMRDAFDGPVTQYGPIFASYTVWKQDRETRLELASADPWQRLNEFTRSIVVRHLWRCLERLSKGAVVVVDSPPQTWTKEINDKFDDQGIDPWPVPIGADTPQYIR